MTDARDLDETYAKPAPPSRPTDSRFAVALVCAVLIVALALVAALRYSRRNASVARALVRSQLALHMYNGGDRMGKMMAISPDGRYLAYVDDSPKTMLRLRDLQAGSEELLPGTEFSCCPFWSPDSRYIGFFAAYRFLKLALDSRITTALSSEEVFGASSWGTSGVILIGTSEGIKSVSADGGPIRNVLLQRGEMIDTRPTFLPDGNHFLFVRQPARTFMYRGGPARCMSARLAAARPALSA